MRSFSLLSLSFFFLCTAILICSVAAKGPKLVTTRRHQFTFPPARSPTPATRRRQLTIPTTTEETAAAPIATDTTALTSSISIPTSSASLSSGLAATSSAATSSPAPTTSDDSGDTSSLLPGDNPDVLPDPTSPSPGSPGYVNPFDPNKHPQLDAQNRLVFKVNTYLSYASIVGGSIVLIVIALMWLYDKKLVDRVSLRLTAVISLVDVVNAVVIIQYVNYPGGDSPTCTAVAAALSFLPEVYLFLTMMIAFNLQLVFLHRRKVTRFSDRWYVPVAFLAALLINIPPLALNRFGYDEGETYDCYYKDSRSTETLYWQIFTFIMPVIVAMVYCTVVLVIVVFKIVFENKRLADTLQTGSAAMSIKAKQKKLLVLKLVSRISLYACIPVLSVTGIVVQYFWEYSHDSNSPLWMNLWSVAGSCIPGTLNCIAFSCDPAVHNALRKVKKDLIVKYGDNGMLIKSTSGSVFSPPPSPMSANAHSPVTLSFRNSNGSLQAPTLPHQRSSLRPIDQDLGNALDIEKRRLQQELQQQQINNRFMKWFVRTFLIPKRTRQEVPNTSLPSTTSYGYHMQNSNDSSLAINETSSGERRFPRPQFGDRRQSVPQFVMVEPTRKRSKLGIFRGNHKVDSISSPIGVSISSPDETESWIASSYTTSGSMRPLNTSYDKQSTSFNQHDADSSAYSQYYYSDEVEIDESSRPSSSILDESDWDENELNAL